MKGRPIGYWAKLLDNLIEASFEQVLGGQTLTRRHWQAINVIQGGPVSQEQVDEALAPFLTEPGVTTRSVVEDLSRSGWVARGDGRLCLTGEGEDAFAQLREKVAANRARITEGISAERYAATVDTLARMCANLQ